MKKEAVCAVVSVPVDKLPYKYNEVEELVKGRDLVFRILQTIGFKFLQGAVFDEFVNSADTFQIVVVKYDETSVFCEVDVDFNIEIVVDSVLKRRNTVFGKFFIVKSAMRDGTVKQPLIIHFFTLYH